MLNEERARLIKQLWEDAPRLFVHGEGTLCMDHTGQDGKEEAWPLSPNVIEWIVETLPEGAVTLETGCGYSTMAFAVCGARHTAVVPYGQVRVAVPSRQGWAMRFRNKWRRLRRAGP
jgi:hypothetical protein